jgi:hypothetical protein
MRGTIGLAAMLLVQPVLAAPSTAPDAPPLSPAGEARVRDGGWFEAGCAKRFAVYAKDRKIVLGKVELTANPKFGLVWRATFRRAGADPQHDANEVMCWKGDLQVAEEMDLPSSLSPF